jgi:hypothetical protein
MERGLIEEHKANVVKVSSGAQGLHSCGNRDGSRFGNGISVGSGGNGRERK